MMIFALIWRLMMDDFSWPLAVLTRFYGDDYIIIHIPAIAAHDFRIRDGYRGRPTRTGDRRYKRRQITGSTHCFCASSANSGRRGGEAQLMSGISGARRAHATLATGKD